MPDLEDEVDEMGEYVSLDGEPPPSVEEDGDGNAYVLLDDQTEATEEPEFFGNLCETLSPGFLAAFGAELVELVERDKEAREKRDELYRESLTRSGLADAPSGADFEGASVVVHPMLLEASVDFSSRVARELITPDGIVKDKIIGKATAAKVEKAARKVRHMNWQLTEQCKDFAPELEQGLTQVPQGGAFYMKTWWDRRLERPAFKAVYVDDIYLPFSATSFESASRRTHAIYITEQDFLQKVESGEYVGDELIAVGQEPEVSKTQEQSDKIEGKQATGYNEDGLRILYEVQIWVNVEEDELANNESVYPYIVTIDAVTRQIVGFYRNWDPDNEDRVEELCCMQEFPFIPWRGAYPLSLFHLIGSLSIAATGALRALLDSALVNTQVTALKLKGGLGDEGGQSKELKATEITEVDGGLTTDDVRKAVMPVPFNPPSPTLFQLLGFLVDAGKGVIRTTFEDLADSNSNVPVGTTMARYEQGMVVYSSIFGRLHRSMGGLMRILHRLNKMYMKESTVYDEAGEVLARRSDYEGPMDVVPVSDPRIYSETQRQMRTVTIMQRATGNPMYNALEVERMFLEQLHLSEDDINRILVDVPVPKMMNAVNENVAATMGRPITAYPEQDQLAHLRTHAPYIMSPLYGQSPNIAPVFMPIMAGHVKEHMAFLYVNFYHQMLSDKLGIPIEELMDEDPDVMKEFDRLLADASPEILLEINKKLEGMDPVIKQMMQVIQQYQPQPQDPTAQALMAETARKEKKDQADVQRDAAKLKLDEAKVGMDGQKTQAQVAKDQQEAALKAAEQQRKDKETQLKLAAQAKKDAEAAALAKEKLRQEAEQSLHDLASKAEDRESEEAQTALEQANKRAMNQEDNATALEIAEMEVESAEKVGVSTGTGINP